MIVTYRRFRLASDGDGVSGMRIERHQIGAKRLRETIKDFAGRIGRSVRLQQEAGRDGFGWQMIANDLLDYAGARSVEDPRIDRDAWMALRSAAEAHLGALELTDPAGPPVSVMIPYTRTGVSYEPAPEDDVSPRGVFERDWQEALYLCVLVGDPRKCWMTFERTAGDAFSPFSRALSDLVFGDGERAGDLIGTPGTDAERALHALATGDQDAFWTAIAAILAQPRGEDPRPRTLLPPAPLALTAIAVRDNGWEQRIESDYLPPSITRGGRSHGAETAQRPRVGPYGADRKPFPLPATVERPPFDDHSEASPTTTPERRKWSRTHGARRRRGRGSPTPWPGTAGNRSSGSSSAPKPIRKGATRVLGRRWSWRRSSTPRRSGRRLRPAKRWRSPSAAVPRP